MNSLFWFIVVFDLVLFALAFYFLKKDNRVGNRDRAIKKIGVGGSARKSTEILKKRKLPQSGFEEMVSEVVDLSFLESLIAASGFFISPVRFLLLSAGLGLLFFVVTMGFAHDIVPLLLLTALGLSIPTAFLVMKRRKREELLVSQMSDALDMVVRSLKVGHSVDGSLKEIGNSFPAPMGTELSLVYEEIAMGLPFDRALKNFERRFPGVSDVKIFCASFIIQRETGGNLVGILENLSQTIRGRFRLKKQVRAHTSEGRMSSLIIGLLPPAFACVAWVVSPDYIIPLFTTPVGRKLLLAALIFETAGFIIMRLMTRIDV